MVATVAVPPDGGRLKRSWNFAVELQLALSEHVGACRAFSLTTVTIDQGLGLARTLDRLNQRYQSMWRLRMSQRITAAKGLTLTPQHGGKTRKPTSNRSMSLKSERGSMVMVLVQGSCRNMNGGSPQLGGKAMTRS